MTSAPKTWRLLLTQPAPGPWNMAIDEAILEFSARGEVPPTLRLYSWNPACLSLGYAQQVIDVNREKLQQIGWEIVRRPTGGKAILHTDELTYSVCGPDSEPRLAGSILQSYHRISTALHNALKLQGITADSGSKTAPHEEIDKNNPVCFEVPSDYELTVDSRKLIGSAQARKKSGVLQHGSLPLFGDLTRILQVLNFPDEDSRQQAAGRLLARAATINDILGYRGDWWLAASAFQEAFQTTFNIDFQTSGLTLPEGIRAFELYNDKYTNPEWTERF